MTPYEQLKARIVKIIDKKTPIELPLPVRYDRFGTMILGKNDEHVADIRGWGRIQYKENPEEKQDEVGEYIAAAINATQEITLADVLRAIKKINPQGAWESGIDAEGRFMYVDEGKHETYDVSWNFSKPLSEQSPETIAFLLEVIPE